ncbi:MAG: S49 family peptidase [Polyangiaceae bacterium]|nr:S49 family peptidase [Polyangiaceae bacterium]
MKTPAPIARQAFGSGQGQPLAIAPSALTMLFASGSGPEVERVGNAAVVPIVGPLSATPGFFLSYGEIVEMVQEAADSDAAQIVLRIDSPGGDVASLFSTCKTIIGIAQKAGKPLITYVDGMACSAGYALALCGQEIHITDTSCVGHVGVLNVMGSHYRADQNAGLDFAVITSGARKADGHPLVPLSEQATASMQTQVDDLASVFFEFAASRRPNIAADGWRALQANSFIGGRAVQQGLADSISDSFYAPTVSTMDELKEALKAMLDSEDEEQAKKAKKALAALEGEDDSEEEAPASEASEEEPAAEDAPAEDDEEDKESAPSASASVDVLKELVSLKREIKALKQVDERKALMAKRPDLTSDSKYRAYMEQLSLKDLRQAVALTPKNPAPNPAAAAQVVPTKGKDQVTTLGQAYKPAPGEPDVAALMGLRAETPEVHSKDGVTVYSRMTASQARAALAAKAK